MKSTITKKKNRQVDMKQPKRFLHVIKTALIYYRELLILNRYGHEEIQIFYTQKYSTYIHLMNMYLKMILAGKL